MKTGGYYWCNKCNEAAFGARCQTCHQPAEFHAQTLAEKFGYPQLDSKPRAGVSQERGHQLFAAMRQKLHML